jgi:hypothetical protein
VTTSTESVETSNSAASVPASVDTASISVSPPSSSELQLFSSEQSVESKDASLN